MILCKLLVRGVPCKQLFYLIGMWYKKDVNCFLLFEKIPYICTQ